MAPLPRPDEMHIQSHTWMQNATDHDDMICERGIPTMITWSYGGKEVAMEGSWDNWKTKYLVAVTVLFFSLQILRGNIYYIWFKPFCMALHAVHPVSTF